MTRTTPLLVTALGLLLAPSAPFAADNAWTVPPATYRYEAAQCPETGVPQRIYRPCEDQMALLAAGLEEARREGKLLLVKLGANWCPNCRALHKQLTGPEPANVLGPSSRLAKTFHVVEIATSALVEGRVKPVPSGEAVLKLLTAAAPDTKVRAIPILAFLDPARTNRVFLRHVDDLVPRGQTAADPKQLGDMLQAAEQSIRQGAAPPAEPGWLRRKLRRFLPV